MHRAWWVEWADACATAGFGFLCVLAAGTVLVVAAKLDYPALEAGSNPVNVLTAIVVLGLATLRIPIGVGGLWISALPLGATALIVWGTSSMARRRARSVTRIDGSGVARDGGRVALVFSVVCFLAAVIFRFRDAANPIGASGLGALIGGGVWGAVLGAATTVRSTGASLRARSLDAIARARARRRWVADAILSAGWMLTSAAILASGAVLVGLIVSFGRGGAHAFGPADAVAALVYLAAFWPNVVVATIAVALGGSVSVGAQVTLGGKLVGPLHMYSYFGWGRGAAPLYVFLLLVIPIASSMVGGLALRGYRVEPARVVESIAVAAGTFAAALGAIAAVASARLGAGLVTSRGVAGVGVSAWQVLLLAFGWAVLGGFAGWWVAGRAWSDRGP